ncbi:MAG: hypothetical protein LBP34_02095 [Flavobacteriaceae bacterium]|jgi:hypothetical protein|nr:hypothetical protein [Flavobacteriaceae bacterium]
MKKGYALLFSVLVLIFSCSKKEEKNTKKSPAEIYQKEGVSFNLPAGWKVKQDYTRDEGRYLELDKYSNYKIESSLAIGILKKAGSTDSILDSQIKQLQFFYQKVTFNVLEEKKNTRLGKYNAITTTYEADDTRNKVYGKISVIQENDKTLFVQIVENKQNTDISDYNAIFNTFTIK